MKKPRKKTLKLTVNTNYGQYAVLLEPDEKTGFIITVAGLPEIITWGKNLRHAKAMAKEAIELSVECRAEESMRGIRTTKMRIPFRVPTRV